MPHLFPPFWLIRVAVAGVWLYEGLWCKLLGREARQAEIVGTVPWIAGGAARTFLKLLGACEVALGVWVLTGEAGFACAVAQSVLLVLLNGNGILWARKLIHDPAGMVVKNFSFLVLAWVAASLPPWW